MALAQALVWSVWAAFLAYTLWCLRQESFWGSVRQIVAFRWGKQICLDLYLGLGLFVLWVFVGEGHWAAKLAWAVAALLLGNLVTLPYLALHLDAWPLGAKP